MALLRKLFYRKPPDGLFEISERVYVFDCCFTIDALEEKDYKSYVGGIVGQLREQYPDASILVFNFREGDRDSPMANALSEYDMTIMEYPRQYEGVPVLLMEVIHHFLRSSESWLSLGLQNLLLMHCERGGWPVLAFMLAALLIYRKQYNVEHKTLDMVYKQAPRELLQMLSPINPIPSQLRYLQYISRRNVAAEWPPKERALTMDCIIIRTIPNFDGQGGCRPIFRLYGQDPLLVSDRAPKVLFSTPKKSKAVLHYKQGECELIKIDINCYVQGDVVMECISLDDGIDQEKIMFRVMFNTSFIRSNILMLGREEIDMLWDAKDRFSKDFRAEVLFSDMDVTASVLPKEHSCFEEKEGLPEEAFAKVQEIFNSVDWLIPKGDAAVEVLQQMGLSNEVLETYSQSAKFHHENKILEARRHSIEDISDSASHNDSLSKKLSPSADLYTSQTLAQRSEAWATVPNAKGESLPSVPIEPRGLAELVGPATPKHLRDISSTLLIPPMHVDGFSLGEPSQEKTPIKSGLSPTSAPYAGRPSFDPPLKNEIVVNEGVSSSATSYPISAEESKDRPSQTMPSLTTSSTEGVVEAPRTDSLISPLTPSTIASAKNVKVNRVAPPPPPPPPPRPLSSPISTSEEPRRRFHPPCPASILPSLDSDTQATRDRGRPPRSPHMTDPTSVSIPSKPSEFEESFTPHSVEETSTTTCAPTSIPEPPCPVSPTKGDSPSSPLPLVTPPLVDRSARKLAPPPPPLPPPKMTSALSSPPPTSSSKDSLASRAACQPEPGPPLKEESGTKAAPPPPPPPPPMPTKDNSSLTDTKSSPPPPPPPPISSKENLSLRGVTPLPPPPPPPLSGKGDAKASPSPPPPPPTPAKLMGPARNGSPSPSPPPPLVPPSGARGKPLLSRTISSKNNQGKKLKPLHWLKLSRAVSGSMWAETQKPGDATKAPEIDISELESLFSAAVPNADQGAKGGKSGSRASVGNKVEKVQLIDLRRANNCEIMLSKVKVPLHDMLSSVLALEENALDVDQVDNLIKFCPTKEEMELLKGYTGDRGKLGKCEQFFLELMKVPRIESKLRVFSFKIQFTAQVSDLRKNLIVVTSAADQIRGSAKLKRIMQTILSLGNALNQGTARGSAIGFRLDSLLKLTETRARNNRMTLMHYLCKVIADKIPEVLDFAQELSSLEPASKVQLKYLAEEMQAINKGLEKVIQELTLSENDGPVSDQFRKALKEFLSFCEGEVRSLTSLYSGVGRNVDALILYFGEDPARCPFEQVISTLLNFTRMLKTAHEENRKQMELEKKKAEKEADNKKQQQLISSGAHPPPQGEKMLGAR